MIYNAIRTSTKLIYTQSISIADFLNKHIISKVIKLSSSMVEKISREFSKAKNTHDFSISYTKATDMVTVEKIPNYKKLLDRLS